MIIYWLKFLIKSHRLLFISITLAVFVVACSLSISKIIGAFMPAFTTVLAQRLKVKITFQRAIYVFPKQVILKDLKVYDQQGQQESIIEIPQVTMDFSFPILHEGKIHLDQINLEHVTTHLIAFRQYMKHSRAALWKELRLLPLLDVNILLSDTKMYLFQDNRIIEPITFKVDFSLLRGQFMGKFKDGESFLQVWGMWRGDNLSISGYMFYQGPMSKEAINILDIQGRLTANENEISLQRLKYSVNGDQFLLNGHWFQEENLPFSFNLSYVKNPKRISLQSPFKGLTLNLQGKDNQGTFVVDGHLDFDLYSDKEISVPLQKGSFDFENLEASIMNDRLFQLKAHKVMGLVIYSDKEYPFRIENLLASVQRSNIGEFSIISSTQMYGGKYHGRFVLDTSSQPWQMESQGQWEKIQVEQLAEISPLFKSVRGLLDGQVRFQAPRNSFSTGQLEFRGADFSSEGILPFKVAELLQMPSLAHVSAVDLFLRFKTDKQGASIDDLKLDSRDFQLRGGLKMDPQGLFLGNISMRFSEALLKESPLGQKVLAFAPEAFKESFDLRLSGSMQKINFQWQDSPLKRQIEKNIPDFIENIIQRRVEEKIPSA